MLVDCKSTYKFTEMSTEPLFYLLVFLNIYEDGRISNWTSVHPTLSNAIERAQAGIDCGCNDGYAIVAEHKTGLELIDHFGLGDEFEVTDKNGALRIDRVENKVCFP